MSVLYWLSLAVERLSAIGSCAKELNDRIVTSTSKMLECFILLLFFVIVISAAIVVGTIGISKCKNSTFYWHEAPCGQEIINSKMLRVTGASFPWEGYDAVRLV